MRTGKRLLKDGEWKSCELIRACGYTKTPPLFRAGMCYVSCLTAANTWKVVCSSTVPLSVKIKSRVSHDVSEFQIALYCVCTNR